MAKMLFEMPELLNLDGSVFDGYYGLEDSGSNCSPGCQDGCAGGCNRGTGAGEQVEPIG